MFEVAIAFDLLEVQLRRRAPRAFWKPPAVERSVMHHQPTMSPLSETPEEIAHLLEVYHRHGRDGRDEDFWAWDRVHDIVRGTDPQRAYDLVRELVRTAPDDRLEHVGAGPVEELVMHHSASLIDQIEAEAQLNPRFCEALASIWLVAEDILAPVLARLQAVTGGRILVATQAEIDAVAGEYDDRDA
jgi:hypothetical protein